MGDSAIVETIGLGGFAMAASPAVARFVGVGGLADAVRITEEMGEICVGEHPLFRMPTLDERGTPVGIDVRRVVETGITPLINTGIAGTRPARARSAPAWCGRRSAASTRRWPPRSEPHPRAWSTAEAGALCKSKIGELSSLHAAASPQYSGTCIPGGDPARAMRGVQLRGGARWQATRGVLA